MDAVELRKKVMGCWLGKAAGGTLGQPYEGTEGPLALTYYDPVPTDMIPNDDLDLQVVWACELAAMERPTVDRDVFAQAWLDHVGFPCDEYGVAIRNLREGLRPPLSGSHDNWFVDGLGGAIRSELWACLAPGKPALAAAYAYEDACVDHLGEGLNAELFLSALESAAFVESDIGRLIDAGLAQIPASSRLAAAIADTRRWCAESSDWRTVWEKIMAKHGSENFTDVVMNLPFMVLALLHGKGDFGRSICLAVNCGMDADCTGATVGAILGIVNPDGIGAAWLKPIGRKLILCRGIVGVKAPATLDEFTDLVLDLESRVVLRSAVSVPQAPPAGIEAECGLARGWLKLDDRKYPPQMPDATERRTFPGCNGGIPASLVPLNSIYLMKFHFNVERRVKARIMFNSASNSRVWVDGQFLFGREGGRLSPSFHRVPINQFGDIELEAGVHELMAGIAPMGKEETLSWTLGVGDTQDMQWLPYAFEAKRPG